MTLAELETEIWVSRGFDRETTKMILKATPTGKFPMDWEIPEECLPHLRVRMEQVIDDTIKKLTILRNN